MTTALANAHSPPPAGPQLLLLGESPPPFSPADFRPFDCASGSRLATFLGLRDRATLIAHVQRRNVFATPTGPKGCPPWDPAAALLGAWEAVRGLPRGSVVVTLGRKVADALGAPAVLGLDPLHGTTWRWIAPDGSLDLECVYVPHPSGASSALNEEPAQRELRRAILPDLVGLCPELRPSSFRLDAAGADRTAFADLGTAVCPLAPGLGMLVLSLAAASQQLFASAAARAAGDCSLASIRQALAGEETARQLLAALGRKGAGRIRSDVKAMSLELVGPADGPYRRHCRERAWAHARALGGL